MKKTAIIIFLVASGAALSSAEKLPDLKKQSSWGEKEKKEFLDYLKSDKPMPEGQVKYVSQDNAKSSSKAPSKAKYLSLAPVMDSVIHDTGTGSKTEPETLGVKMLMGTHLFSWVRLYTGAKYNRVGQDRLDGSRAHFSHLEIPVGLELALIPLGTPHTRYVLLRGGISEHRFWGAAKKTDFSDPLLGWTLAWNLGVGYEWQFSNSNWRFHALAEGYRSFAGGSTSFYGAGITSGFVYTF